MEFYQTPMGRKFFQADVPALIRQLKRIADKMPAQTGSIKCTNCSFITVDPIEGLCHACHEKTKEPIESQPHKL